MGGGGAGFRKRYFDSMQQIQEQEPLSLSELTYTGGTNITTAVSEPQLLSTAIVLQSRRTTNQVASYWHKRLGGNANFTFDEQQ